MSDILRVFQPDATFATAVTNIYGFQQRTVEADVVATRVRLARAFAGPDELFCRAVSVEVDMGNASGQQVIGVAEGRRMGDSVEFDRLGLHPHHPPERAAEALVAAFVDWAGEVPIRAQAADNDLARSLFEQYGIEFDRSLL